MAAQNFTMVSMSKNIMGTMSFTLKMGKMRKQQEFSTYPIQKGDKVIYLQSKGRWAQMDPEGNLQMSAKHGDFANNIHLAIDKVKGVAEYIKVPEEILKQMLDAIRSTSGVSVGDSVVKCDNSGASEI